MQLLEREFFLEVLHTQLSAVAEGEGHCVFVNGEAGIGKTSLVKAFCKDLKKDHKIYRGTCDALFAPRPLAPIYDVAGQMNCDHGAQGFDASHKPGLFNRFVNALASETKPCIIVFEDIHWADEATLDFIRFFARRITQIPCLFILTYREDDVQTSPGLRTILGQLPPDSFTRVALTPLSKDAVKQLAQDKGFDGEELFQLTGGNPFYVTEILASYSQGIPESIKDAVLSSYHRTDENTRRLWDLLSVIPQRFKLSYLEKLEPQYAPVLEGNLKSGILVISEGMISFKHELFRRTIEASLSPLKRTALNRQVLAALLENVELSRDVERIIHHAKEANAYEIVVRFAPVAAQLAAATGAHLQAARLYLSAIEYSGGSGIDLLLPLYESYAYECYLTNQMEQAILYTGKALSHWKELGNVEKTGNCLRFLSRLWWFEGNRQNAEYFGEQSVDILKNLSSSTAKAMAFSNMAQLKMLAGRAAECIAYGEKAIAIACELNDEETLSHALNNVGAVQMRIPCTRQKGKALLLQSLDIAIKNSCHEHAARAYNNLGINYVAMKEYQAAADILEQGIQYSEERELDSWVSYMQAWKARLKLETGHCKVAVQLAESILQKESSLPVAKLCALGVIGKIKMRRGDADASAILHDAKQKVFALRDLQSIIPAMLALLEFEWITGTRLMDEEALSQTLTMIAQSDNFFDRAEFYFWLFKARGGHLHHDGVPDVLKLNDNLKELRSPTYWQKLGCSYEQAVCLYEGTESQKKEALTIMQQLGATAVYKKMKRGMRMAGIKKIPLGRRMSTQKNPALLTNREIEVLQCLHKGLQNKEIAATLFISPKTVDHHLSAIFFKLEVNSRTKAVKEAVRLRIVNMEATVS